MKKLLLFVVLTCCTHILFAQAGTLDATFGMGGKVTTSLGSNARSCASAVQSDGKFILAGNRYNGSNNDFAVARYNSDGSLDAGFGTSGQVVTDFGNEDNLASVTIQPNGKIVVAGHVNNGNDFDFGVVRYNVDGSLDNGFGTAGKATLPITPGNDYVAGVHILSDGKIVVTGTKTWSGYDYVLARFNPDGNVDNSFGNNGIVIADIYATDVAEASVLQPDGKIVVGGFTYQGGNQWEIARFNAGGTLDVSFGNGASGAIMNGGGIVVGGMSGVIYKLAVQADGKIVAVGSNGNSFDLIRYNADGSFDNSFNGNGRVANTVSGSAAATSVTLQPNGKILVGGYSTISQAEDFTLMRYNADGTPLQYQAP